MRRLFLTYFNKGYDAENEDLSEAIASAWFKIYYKHNINKLLKNH